MKSILVAYLLWLLGGPFFGLHKFYLGRPFMGLLYMCTCGGFFLGWIADFFTLPHQVQMANFLLQHQHERPSSAVRRELEHLKHLLYRQLAGDPSSGIVIHVHVVRFHHALQHAFHFPKQHTRLEHPLSHR